MFRRRQSGTIPDSVRHLCAGSKRSADRGLIIVPKEGGRAEATWKAIAARMDRL